VAKIEAGRFNFTIDTLYMLAGALGKDIEFVRRERPLLT
jgi:transcriptional regulator with XRE-family HTH domain